MLMETTLEDIAQRILEDLNVPSFPDGYMRDGEKVTEHPIPTGTEIAMYRQLEGVSVMIGDEVLFFKNHYEAKFVYYCAKRGLDRARMPETQPLKRVLRDFQNDIEGLRKKIEDEAASRGLTDEETDEVIGICSSRLGYNDIMDI